jgi:hypothetical protein
MYTAVRQNGHPEKKIKTAHANEIIQNNPPAPTVHIRRCSLNQPQRALGTGALRVLTIARAAAAIARARALGPPAAGHERRRGSQHPAHVRFLFIAESVLEQVSGKDTRVPRDDGGHDESNGLTHSRHRPAALGVDRGDLGVDWGDPGR